MRSRSSVQRHCRLAVLLGTAALPAWPVAAGDWTASVAATSNYLVHGLSRSAGDPALQVHVGWVGERQWAAGLWASTVELYSGPGPRRELDYYLSGYLPLGRDWQLAGQITRYEFPGDSSFFLAYDYTELSVALSFRDALSLAVAVSPDYSFYSTRGLGIEETALSCELAARHPLTRHLRLTGGVGLSDPGSPAGAGYWYWSGGGEIGWRDVSFSLSYVGTDGRARRLFGGEAGGDAWIATLALRLH